MGIDVYSLLVCVFFLPKCHWRDLYVRFFPACSLFSHNMIVCWLCTVYCIVQFRCFGVLGSRFETHEEIKRRLFAQCVLQSHSTGIQYTDRAQVNSISSSSSSFFCLPFSSPFFFFAPRIAFVSEQAAKNSAKRRPTFKTFNKYRTKVIIY